MDAITETVKRYIVENIIPGQEPADIDLETNLKESGILDSLSTLKLLQYLEAQFNVELHSEDLDEKHFSSVATIGSLIGRKVSSQKSSWI